jgi:hypothetical protein
MNATNPANQMNPMNPDQCFRNWGTKLGSEKYRFGVQFGVHLGPSLGSFSTKMPLKRAQDLTFFFFFFFFHLTFTRYLRNGVERALYVPRSSLPLQAWGALYVLQKTDSWGSSS